MLSTYTLHHTIMQSLSPRTTDRPNRNRTEPTAAARTPNLARINIRIQVMQGMVEQPGRHPFSHLELQNQAPRSRR